MTTLSTQPVINSIKYLQAEYPDGVPFKILALEVGLSDDDLKEILLNFKDLIFIENEQIKIIEKVSEDDLEGKTLEKVVLLEKVEPSDLSAKEITALEIMKNLADESGRISRHVLEGNLLYGDLQLSTLGVYNLIISLENKQLLKKIQLTDGEYYSILY